MKLKKFSLMTLVLLGVSLSSIPQAGAVVQLAQRQTRYNYPKEVVNSYMATCRQAALEAGLSKGKAEQLCRCTVNRFQQRYSVARFRALMAESKKGRSPRELTDVGAACMEDI